MTTTAKIGITLVVVLVIITIGWMWYNNSAKITEVERTTAVESVTPTPTPTPKIPNTAGTGLSEEKDTSNEALQTDISAVENQIKAINTDASNIDQSLKDN